MDFCVVHFKLWRPMNGFIAASWGVIVTFIQMGARLNGFRILDKSIADAFAFPLRDGDRSGPGRIRPVINYRDSRTESALRSITRVIGFQPIFDRKQGGQSGEEEAVFWTQSLLEAGPALNHIGIVAQDTSITVSYEHVTKTIARVLLASPRVLSLCFRRVSSQAIQRTHDELRDFVQRVADPRLKIVVDERVRPRWYNFEFRIHQIEIGDVMKCRDFWTRCRWTEFQYTMWRSTNREEIV